MTEIQDSLYPEDWKKTARKDWKRIKILLEENDADGAAFPYLEVCTNLSKKLLISRSSLFRKEAFEIILDRSETF